METTSVETNTPAIQNRSIWRIKSTYQISNSSLSLRGTRCRTRGLSLKRRNLLQWNPTWTTCLRMARAQWLTWALVWIRTRATQIPWIQWTQWTFVRTQTSTCSKTKTTTTASCLTTSKAATRRRSRVSINKAGPSCNFKMLNTRAPLLSRSPLNSNKSPLRQWWSLYIRSLHRVKVNEFRLIWKISVSNREKLVCLPTKALKLTMESLDKSIIRHLLESPVNRTRLSSSFNKLCQLNFKPLLAMRLLVCSWELPNLRMVWVNVILAAAKRWHLLATLAWLTTSKWTSGTSQCLKFTKDLLQGPQGKISHKTTTSLQWWAMDKQCRIISQILKMDNSVPLSSTRQRTITNRLIKPASCNFLKSICPKIQPRTIN